MLPHLSYQALSDVLIIEEAQVSTDILELHVLNSQASTLGQTVMLTHSLEILIKYIKHQLHRLLGLSCSLFTLLRHYLNFLFFID